MLVMEFVIQKRIVAIHFVVRNLSDLHFLLNGVFDIFSLYWICLSGVPWTEEEHRLFLIGLQKLGKGDWRGIARNFVTSRTPTQVASHAQKYFIRQSNANRKKRRSSLFDMVCLASYIILGVSQIKTLESSCTAKWYRWLFSPPSRLSCCQLHHALFC